MSIAQGLITQGMCEDGMVLVQLVGNAKQTETPQQMGSSQRLSRALSVHWPSSTPDWNIKCHLLLLQFNPWNQVSGCRTFFFYSVIMTCSEVEARYEGDPEACELSQRNSGGNQHQQCEGWMGKKNTLVRTRWQWERRRSGICSERADRLIVPRCAGRVSWWPGDDRL